MNKKPPIQIGKPKSDGSQDAKHLHPSEQAAVDNLCRILARIYRRVETEAPVVNSTQLEKQAA